MTLRWPDQAPWRQSFRKFTESQRRVCYDRPAANGTAEAWRCLREQLEALSAEELRYLPADFAEALLQGIEGGTAEDWQRFSRFWTPTAADRLVKPGATSRRCRL